MTAPDTKRLRELLGRATPGEWTWDHDYRGWPGLYAGRTEREPGLNLLIPLDSEACSADFDLIVALHTAAPALLDAAERCAGLEQENAALRAFYDKAMKLVPLIDGVTGFAALHNHKWPEGDEHNWRKEREAVESLRPSKEAP